MNHLACIWVVASIAVVVGGCSAPGAATGVAHPNTPASSGCEVAWRTEVPAGQAPAGAIVVSATAARSEIEARACAHGATVIVASPVDSRLAAGRRTFVFLRSVASATVAAPLSADIEDRARELAGDAADEGAAVALADGVGYP